MFLETLLRSWTTTTTTRNVNRAQPTVDVARHRLLVAEDNLIILLPGLILSPGVEVLFFPVLPLLI